MCKDIKSWSESTSREVLHESECSRRELLVNQRPGEGNRLRKTGRLQEQEEDTEVFETPGSSCSFCMHDSISVHG